MVEIPDVGGIHRRLVRQHLTDGLPAVPRVHDIGLRRERGPRRAAALAQRRPFRHRHGTKVNEHLCQGRTRLGVEARGGCDEPDVARACQGPYEVKAAEMPAAVKGPRWLAGYGEHRERPVHGRTSFRGDGAACPALNCPALGTVDGAIVNLPARGRESLPSATLCWRNRVDFFMVSRRRSAPRPVPPRDWSP